MAQPLSTNLPWELANPKWASSINPILALPILNGTALTNIVLTAGKPLAINHLLGRMPQGWFLTDKDTNANVWRPSDTPFNIYTLTLATTANTTVSIWVY